MKEKLCTFGKEILANPARLAYIGKERDKESSLADHGVRKYDAETERFTSCDALWGKYISLTPYQYSGNNPISFVDYDGRKISIPNKRDQAQLLEYINKNSKIQFGINKKNELVIKEGAINKNGSQKYSDALLSGISLKDKTLTLKIGQSYNSGGQLKDVDTDAGGGVTITPATQAPCVSLDQRARVAGDPTVIISGNSYLFLPGNVIDTPDLILIHEIVGHAIPIMLRKMNGNAVENENEVRKELHIEERHPEPNHKESTFGG